MLREVELCTVLSPQIYQIWVIGKPVIGLLIEVRL